MSATCMYEHRFSSQLFGMPTLQHTGSLTGCKVATPHAYSHRKRLASTLQHSCIACGACKPTTVLPNGLEVCYASKHDVSFLYREIFQEQTYFKHGPHLQEGNVVVDVGGNIGLFALFAAGLVGSSGKVISAEPIPPLHEKLSYNISSHRAWCSDLGDP